MSENNDKSNNNNNNSSNNGESISIKEVFALLKKEVESPGVLQAIDADTYQRIASALASLKGQGFEGVEAKVRDRMVELMSQSARLLIEVRQSKVRAATTTTTTTADNKEEPLDYSKLTDEEKYVLDGQAESASRMEQVVSATAKGRPKVLESISSRIRSKQIVVRFVRPMEQFIGVDMYRYGPFQEEDVATLPLENARSFIETGVAVQVHAQL
ncbi:MAG: hypothetical protein AB1753_06655 [Thermoproteota archaeon]